MWAQLGAAPRQGIAHPPPVQQGELSPSLPCQAQPSSPCSTRRKPSQTQPSSSFLQGSLCQASPSSSESVAAEYGAGPGGTALGEGRATVDLTTAGDGAGEAADGQHGYPSDGASDDGQPIGSSEKASDCRGAADTSLSSLCHIPVEDGKRAQPSKDWWQRAVVPRALAFIRDHLARGKTVLICCDHGDDRAPAVALAALVAFYGDDAATLSLSGPCAPVSKEDVRARLALLQGAYSHARVPRLFMKELSNFFVSQDGGWRALSRVVPTTDAPSEGNTLGCHCGTRIRLD